MLVVAVHSELAAAILACGLGPQLPAHARCPRCEGRLSPWTSYTRLVRHRGATTRLRVCRCRCRRCERTHALLPSFLLAYRRDVVTTVGQALVGAARGAGHDRWRVTPASPPRPFAAGCAAHAAPHTRTQHSHAGCTRWAKSSRARPRAATRWAGCWTRSPRSTKPPTGCLPASIAARSALPR